MVHINSKTLNLSYTDKLIKSASIALHQSAPNTTPAAGEQSDTCYGAEGARGCSQGCPQRCCGKHPRGPRLCRNASPLGCPSPSAGEKESEELEASSVLVSESLPESRRLRREGSACGLTAGISLVPEIDSAALAALSVTTHRAKRPGPIAASAPALPQPQAKGASREHPQSNPEAPPHHPWSVPGAPPEHPASTPRASPDTPGAAPWWQPVGKEWPGHCRSRSSHCWPEPAGLCPWAEPGLSSFLALGLWPPAAAHVFREGHLLQQQDKNTKAGGGSHLPFRLHEIPLPLVLRPYEAVKCESLTPEKNVKII